MNNENWLAEFLDESIPLWTNDPVLFMREVLLFETVTLRQFYYLIKINFYY